MLLDDGDGAAAAQLRAYCHQRRTGRPWLRAKWAMTLDGRLATSAGSSRWVSGAAARAWVHEQRDRADALLVGAGTVLADDPQLTVRLDDSPRPPRQPLRIVVDSAGRTPADARLFTDGAAPTLWVVGADHQPPPRPGVEQLVLPELDGHVDLAALAAELGRRGLLDILCEAGGGLTGALLRAGLVDEVAAIVAPKLVGGSGPTAWTGPGQEPMSAALELVDPEWQQLGRDILIIGRLRNE
ncbi:MAG TPA: hypothetical protein DCZ72_06870 [Armatimonadetes bacterium]|nr:hypothetical protein [Armatimonadota bacterium]